MKFFVYVIIISGMLIFLNLGGIPSPATGTILSYTGINIHNDANNFNVSTSGVMDSKLFGNESSGGLPVGLKFLLITLAISGIVIGLFGKSPDISWVMGVMIFGVGSVLISDMLFILGLLISYGESWMIGIGIAIFAPLIIGFYVAMINFWRGND